MKFGDSEIVRQEGEIRLNRAGARHDRETFYGIGNGDIRNYEEYDDALE